MGLEMDLEKPVIGGILGDFNGAEVITNKTQGDGGGGVQEDWWNIGGD